MSIKYYVQGGIARITLSGRFDFGMQYAFKQAYAPLIENSEVQQIEVELSLIEHLDSSALGMLILLNQRALGSKKSVTLLNPSGVASQVLEVANFKHILTIAHSVPQRLTTENS